MKSVLQKLSQCAGLIDTKDVSEWENGFLKNVVERCESDDTTVLTEKQVEVLDRIYNKHFA